MPEYLANRPDQIVDTAIRCLTKLSQDDPFTESTIALGESSKPEDNPSLRDKIIRTIDNATKAIENHGKAAKERDKAYAKHLKSRKDLPNKQVKVKDTKRLKVLANNTKKEVRKACKEGGDKSTFKEKLDKIMEAYRKHRKAILTTIGLSVVAIPALIRGIMDGYDDAINDSTDDMEDFDETIKRVMASEGMDPQSASAAVGAYAELNKDCIKADEEQFSSAVNAVRESLDAGDV